MGLPIQQVKALPRKAKRRVWLGWWKHRRQEIPGETRAARRENWRALWGQLRTPRRA
jgi:hypothetical protein